MPSLSKKISSRNHSKKFIQTNFTTRNQYTTVYIDQIRKNTKNLLLVFTDSQKDVGINELYHQITMVNRKLFLAKIFIHPKAGNVQTTKTVFKKFTVKSYNEAQHKKCR